MLRRRFLWSRLDVSERDSSSFGLLEASLPLLLALLLPAVLFRTASAEVYTLEQIRKGYLENLDRIVTMEVRGIYTSYSGVEPDDSNAEGAVQVHWVGDGKRYLIDWEQPPNSRFTKIKIQSDGRRQWMYQFVSGQAEPHSILESRMDSHQSSESYTHTSVLYGLGLPLGLSLIDNKKLSLSALSVADIMASGKCHVDGVRRFREADCVVVKCPGWQLPGDPMAVDLEFAFDASAGFCLRHIGRHLVSNGIETDADVDILAVRQISSELGEAWFPVNVISRIASGDGTAFCNTLELHTIKLNEQPVRTLFQPSPQLRGIIVPMRDVRRVRETQISLARARKAVAGAGALHPEFSSPPLAVGEPGVTASPSRVSVNWWGLALGLACLGIGLRLRAQS